MMEQEARTTVAGTETQTPEAQEISLLEILTELAVRKKLIAITTGAAMAIGIALAFLLPVRYTATVKLMPPQQTQSSAAMMMMSQLSNSGAGSLAALAGGGLGLKNPNDIYIGLLQSRPVADAIIRNFDLQKTYRAKDMTSARKALAGNTTITSEKSGLISIAVTDKDKKRVAAMANMYTEQLRVLTKNLAVTEAQQRRMFYEDQLRQAKDALVNAEVAFEKVQKQKGLVVPDAQSRMMFENLATLRAQAAAKEVQVQALRSFSTEHNPDVQLAEHELAALRTEIAKLEQGGETRNKIAGLGLADVPEAGIDFLRAQRELLYHQTLYELLIKQYDAAKLDESKEAAIIQVVEPAIEPDRKSSPLRTLLVALFTAGGLLLGCMLAFLQSWYAQVCNDPVAAERIQRFRKALAQ